MISWLSSLYTKIFKPTENFEQVWNHLLPGDHVQVFLKDPKTVGVVSPNNDNLTYQRLDEEDIKTLVIEGYVIGKNIQGLYPTKIEFLELNVIKKTGSRQKFVVYMLLKEEIDRVVSL